MEEVLKAKEPEPVNDSRAWLFAGPLGSGKSIAAKHAEWALHSRGESVYTTEFSDHVRYCYESETDDEDVDDNGLGVWAADKRDEHGMDYFAERLASELGGPVPAARNVIVSGVRSPSTPPLFEERFGNVTTVVMWAAENKRQDRVSEVPEAFHQRNEREMVDWECIEFYRDGSNYDYLVPNHYDDEELLAMHIRRIVLDVVDGSRDASIYENAPWHPSNNTYNAFMGCF